MGWREDGELEKALRYLCHGVGSNEEVFAALLAMPPADRIALARELLPPGFVVAREVGDECGEVDPPAVPQKCLKSDVEYVWARAWLTGWNACRAAMMEGEE